MAPNRGFAKPGKTIRVMGTLVDTAPIGGPLKKWVLRRSGGLRRVFVRLPAAVSGNNCSRVGRNTRFEASSVSWAARAMRRSLPRKMHLANGATRSQNRATVPWCTRRPRFAPRTAFCFSEPKYFGVGQGMPGFYGAGDGLTGSVGAETAHRRVAGQQ